MSANPHAIRHSQGWAAPDDEPEAFYGEFRSVIGDIESKEAFRAGRRLDTVDTATTQRVVDGQVVTTDGPFAETKAAYATAISLTEIPAERSFLTRRRETLRR